MSHRNGVLERGECPISVNIYRSQMSSRAASDAATYSDSVVEIATQRCFLLVQEIRQPLMKKQLPLVDLIDRCELAHSASV